MERKMPIFADRFLELRGKRTQEEFAKFLGISRPTVGFYEAGQRLPDALVLRQIAEKCNVSADYLLGLTDEKTAEQDIQAICKKTGLCETSIKAIMSAKESDANCDGTYFDLINNLISDGPTAQTRYSFFGWLAECLLNYQNALFVQYTLDELTANFFVEEFDKIGCTDIGDLDCSTRSAIVDTVSKRMEEERIRLEMSDLYSERTRKMFILQNRLREATKKCNDPISIPNIEISDIYKNEVIQCLTFELEGCERAFEKE